MFQSRILSAIALVAVILCQTQAAFAATEVIEFPDDELAVESVLPVFDHPEGVKSRNAPTARRLEIGVTGSYALTEAFANPLAVGLVGSYHLNEAHGINLLANFNMSGMSSYAEQLNPIPNTTANANLQYAPQPKYLFLASYQYTGFYGKISLTKETVMNLGLYGLLGAGMIGIGDASNPVISVGIGQKFYLNSSFGVRFDLRAIGYQGPDILSKNLSAATSEQSASTFDKKFQFGSLITAGVIYLLPSF